MVPVFVFRIFFDGYREQGSKEQNAAVEKLFYEAVKMPKESEFDNF